MCNQNTSKQTPHSIVFQSLHTMLLLVVVLVLPLTQGIQQGKPALQEEVNVLVYGTLQLGQALKDTYSSTNTKLQRITNRQARQEQTIDRLKTQILRTRQERQKLREEAERIQSEDLEGRKLYQRMEQDLREARDGYGYLQRRVQRLEKKVLVKTRALPALKEKVEQQSLILQVLMEDSERQKNLMAKQREQLLNLLKQASMRSSS